MPFFLAIMALLIGLVGSAYSGHKAQAQGVMQPQRLDRRGLHPTFTEDFKHFAASANGSLEGHPVWQTRFFYGDRTLGNNKETEWYQDDGPDGPFRVIDGVLEITAEPEANLPQGMTYRSGMIMSQHLFNQRYGYFEMSAQLPRGRGMWPAFWMLPTDGSWPPEIDVMEMLGHAPETYYVSLHDRPKGPPLDEVAAIVAPDLSAGFHVFGVSWRPDHISFYLDDVLVHESATPTDMNRAMYLVANLAVGGAGSWPGQVESAMPHIFRIAWIRGWQFKDLDAVSP